MYEIAKRNVIHETEMCMHNSSIDLHGSEIYINTGKLLCQQLAYLLFPIIFHSCDLELRRLTGVQHNCS